MFIISTYTNGNPPEAAQWFYKYIVESSDDCRVPKELFKGLRFAIFGLGNSLYGDNFNKVSESLCCDLIYECFFLHLHFASLSLSTVCSVTSSFSQTILLAAVVELLRPFVQITDDALTLLLLNGDQDLYYDLKSFIHKIGLFD